MNFFFFSFLLLFSVCFLLFYNFYSIYFLALDLLMKMLEKNPDKRPSAKECLGHLFITRDTQNENFKIHGDDMSKLEKNMENMKINNNLYNFGKG